MSLAKPEIKFPPAIHTSRDEERHGCCPPPDAAAGACPHCGVMGQPVRMETVQAWCQPDARLTLGNGPYLICKSADCPVVYFTADGRRVDQREVVARVGCKTGAGPSVVCYCFGHTREAIESEIRVTGDSRVAALISAEIKAGRCACEVKNPEGRCCLGEVNRIVKALRSDLSVKDESAGEYAPSESCYPSRV